MNHNDRVAAPYRIAVSPFGAWQKRRPKRTAEKAKPSAATPIRRLIASVFARHFGVTIQLRLNMNIVARHTGADHAGDRGQRSFAIVECA